MASHAPRYAEAQGDWGTLPITPRPGIETAFDVARDDLVAVLTSLRDEHDYQQDVRYRRHYRYHRYYRHHRYYGYHRYRGHHRYYGYRGYRRWY